MVPLGRGAVDDPKRNRRRNRRGIGRRLPAKAAVLPGVCDELSVALGLEERSRADLLRFNGAQAAGSHHNLAPLKLAHLLELLLNRTQPRSTRRICRRHLRHLRRLHYSVLGWIRASNSGCIVGFLASTGLDRR